MKTIISILTILLFLHTSLFAQLDDGKRSVNRSVELLNNFPNLGGGAILVGRAVPPSSVKGTYYLDKEWRAGAITFIDGEVLDNYPIRYHIENDQFEIKVESENKMFVYDAVHVKDYTTINELGKEQYFVYCKKCSYNDRLTSGLFEVLQSGKMNLLRKSKIYIKPSTYVRGKDMGDRSEKIIIEEEYYIKEGNLLKKVRKNSQWNIAIFPENTQDKLVKYAKSNKLNFRKIEDLIIITDYYNTIE